MNNSRTRKSAKNVVVNIAMQIFGVVMSFFSRTIFIHVLSAEYLGINGLFGNVLALLSFAELGIGAAIGFAMYSPMANGDHEQLGRLMNFYKKAYRAIAAVVVAMGLGFSFFLDSIVQAKPDIPENFQVIFWLFVLDNACSYLLADKRTILSVGQESYISTMCTQGCKVVLVILQVAVLLLTHNYYLYLIVQIGCTLLSNLIIAWIVDKRYPYLRDTEKLTLGVQEKETIFRDVKALTVTKTAGVISNGADNIIISKLINLSSVGLASNYTLTINAVNGIVWQGLNSLIGSIGNLNVNSDIQKRKKVFKEIFLLSYWVYSDICVCLMVLLNPFIELWLGTSYLLPTNVVIALVFITYMGGMNFPVFSFRVTLGIFDQVKWFNVLSGLANIVLSIVLGQHFGMFGIYLATSISRLFILEIAEGYFIYKIGFNEPVYKYIVRYLLHTVLYAGNYIISKVIVGMIPFGGIVGLIAKAATCFFVCNMITFLTFAKTKSFASLVARMKMLLKIS